MPCDNPGMDTPHRRRSPGWVRDLSQTQLHALAGRLCRLYRTEGLSEQQDWLLDCCISELEYRQRRTSVWLRCTCELCMSPFED